MGSVILRFSQGGVFVFGHGAVVRECAREKLIVTLQNQQTDGQKDERTDGRSVQ